MARSWLINFENKSLPLSFTVKAGTTVVGVTFEVAALAVKVVAGSSDANK